MSVDRGFWLDVPDLYRLDSACARIQALWPFSLYLVGSVHERRDWRDVDLRLILPDKKYARMKPEQWLFLNAAVSDQLKAMTGLPIDFQFQPQTEANEHKGKRRPMGWIR